VQSRGVRTSPHGPAEPRGLDLPLGLGHRLEQLAPALTRALGPVARPDGVLLLLGALSLAVLVVVSFCLLRLLARIRGEGWEMWGS
jgi:hypothetical protein